ncbi:MAG TPA: flagellar motor protein MotB [bacterium]|nr:flagellar motor protein MotB [bacterium]
MINFRGEDVSNINAWQVPYANLMTILMIFFMVLYSFYHVTGSTKYEQIINSIQEEFGYELESKDMERLRRIKNEEDMQKAVREFRQRKGLRQFTQVRVEQEKISIILSDPILFTSGSDELKSETIWILSELADILRGVKENEVIVEGHTDDIPLKAGAKFASNWELSLARAFSVVRYLTEIEGLDPNRFIPTGYGEHRALFPNDSPVHRAQNRRIEICILKTT